jgi:hypothetical protein
VPPGDPDHDHLHDLQALRGRERLLDHRALRGLRGRPNGRRRRAPAGTIWRRLASGMDRAADQPPCPRRSVTQKRTTREGQPTGTSSGRPPRSRTGPAASRTEYTSRQIVALDGVPEGRCRPPDAAARGAHPPSAQKPL